VAERIAGRAAHEVKNALNGVAVNLEVVRGRLARAAGDPGGVAAASAARFADVAGEQLEALSALSEAMLALARPPREPADVGQLVAPLAVLLDAVARSEGGSLALEVDEETADGATRVAAGARVARLVLAAALDAAVRRGRAVRCRVERVEHGAGVAAPAVRVRVAWAGGADDEADRDLALPRDVAAAAAAAGIGVDPARHGVTLTFAPAAPAAAGTSTNTEP
jgi:signal transduction histidine kinase